MSESVERRLLTLLGHPTESPYGNPIPGLEELGETVVPDAYLDGLQALSAVASEESRSVVVRRIGEPIQDDGPLMSSLRRAGVRPGSVVSVRSSAGGLVAGSHGETVELSLVVAAHVFVHDETAADPAPGIATPVATA